jgi:Tfp pilus assembly pilus retraction ATPase PilT
MDDIRLGAILLEGGIVDEAGLERCLAIQALMGNTRPIGQILVEQGLIDEPSLKRLLSMQRERADVAGASLRAGDLGCAALLTAALGNGAAEIVVSEGRPVRIRVGSLWTQLTDIVLSGPEVWDFVRETMGGEVLEALAEHHFVVRPWQVDGVGRGLATAFRQFEGVAVRATFAPTQLPTPESIDLPAAVTDAVRAGRGLVLVVGERGLGRTEALGALVHAAAADASHYVVVVDDEPLALPATGAVVVRRRFGITPHERSQSLRSVVREDPDAMVIADVGDAETFEIALRAAEGGRLVIAYLDAPNSTAALTRILNFYPVHDLARVRASLAAVLRTVLVRHLLPDAEHKGTVVATELLVVDDAACEVIRRGDLGDIALLLRAEGSRCGHSLDRSMLELLVGGRVRMDDVFARTEEKAWLLEKTRSLKTTGE